MDKLKECQIYIRRWYMGEPVLTINMATDALDETCIQYMVVELLKNLIDQPFPTHVEEGTPMWRTSLDLRYKKVMDGLQFNFRAAEECAVKNLAWLYFVQGITTTLKSVPEDRVYKCWRDKVTRQ